MPVLWPFRKYYLGTWAWSMRALQDKCNALL
jgi:hypothetical protein